MLKFSDLTDELLSTIDEIECYWEEKEKSNQKMLEHLKESKSSDNLIKRWESASKMRLYLQEKKKDLADAVKVQVENDFKQKKKEEREKKEQEK